MITVHHLENSRSQRVLWLLEELGIEYEIKHYKRDPKSSLAPPDLKLVHPLGKSLVISDGDIVVAETGAIIEYLVENYGSGRLIPPAGSPDRLRYTYWMHAGEGTVMPLVVMSLIFNRVDTVAPWIIRPIAKAVTGTVRTSYLNPNLDANLAYMESELDRSEWFAGDEFTAADIQMSFPVEATAARSGIGSKYPKLKAFLERIHRRPAYEVALERGGPYSIMTG